MKTLYCPKCDATNEVIIKAIDETYIVRGEEISTNTNVAHCTRCKEQVFSEELDNKTLERVYSEFRQRRGILTPDQIRSIRKQYGLSQRALSRLLRLGEITIHRYESGSLPSDAHNELLLLIEEPANVKKILDQTGSDLSPTEEERLRKRLDELLIETNKTIWLTSTYELLSSYEPSLFSGFKKFEPDKIREMIALFAQRATNLSKTKLMKLFFYSDFYHFKNNAVSISGLQYAHLPYGPVIDNYTTLLSWLEFQDIIKVTPTDTETGWELISSTSKVESILEPEEIKTLEHVIKRFGNLTAKELSDYSHEEKAYTKTTNGQLISYEFAFDLN